MAAVKYYKISSAGLPTESEATDDLTIGSISVGQMNSDNIRIDGNAITSQDTNGDITITPNGTGDIVLDGQNWPQADGSANQFLKTDGAGQLSWAAPSAVAAIDTANFVAASGGIAARDVVYVSAAGEVDKADASAESTSRAIGFATASASGAAAASVQVCGVLSGFSGLTAGSRYYLSETAGAVTATIPTTAAANVIQVGYAAATTKMLIQIVPLVIRT